MRVLIFFATFFILNAARAAKPARAYCLEELNRLYAGDNITIAQKYSQTGESACFALKTHVARCLDKSLWRLIKTIKPETILDEHTPPSLDIKTMETAMSHYMDLKRLPKLKEILNKCAHPDPNGGVYQAVITVGDFSRRCECDLGNEDNCEAYEHVRIVFDCGKVEEGLPIMQ